MNRSVNTIMGKMKFYLEESNFFTDFVRQHMDFEETSKDACDAIISSKFPVGIYKKKEIQKKIDSYRNEKKIVVLFLITDNESPLQLYPNIVLFRTSLKKSKKDSREYLLPYVWECYQEPLQVLLKTEKPIIGFCGSIQKNLGKRMSSILAIQKNSSITSNFILRTAFWGGKPQDTTLKEEFKQNILESHCTLSNRGRGNFSMRFYQVLSLGRIPVLINSDMAFPLEDEINWKNYCITASNEKDLSKAILDWWHSKSEEEIIEAQQNCYSLFQDYFTEKKYAQKAQQIIQKRIENYDPEQIEKISIWKKIKTQLNWN